MGQRSATQTLAGIMLAFIDHRTWTQAELARHLGLGVPATRKHLLDLEAGGMPLEQQHDHPHVYWSVPKNWFPSAVFFKGEDVPLLLRQLARSPRNAVSRALMEHIVRGLPQDRAAESTGDTVDPPPMTQVEEQFLALVEDSGQQQRTLKFRYLTTARQDPEWRLASVQRVLPGPPARFVAWCHKAQRLRWFRVENLLSGHLEDGSAFHPVAHADVDEFLAVSLDGFHDGGPAVECSFTVRFPEARWVRNNLFPNVQVQSRPEGIRVTLRTAGVSRLARFVVGLGGAAAAENVELREAVQALARGALETNGAGTPEHAG